MEDAADDTSLSRSSSSTLGDVRVTGHLPSLFTTALDARLQNYYRAHTSMPPGQ